jgi:hypothetical protein
MLQPLIKRPGRSAVRRSGERGVTMALVALSMVAIISFAALAIDLGTLYEARAEAQRSADAAALAAARVMSESGLTGDPTNSDSNWASICGTSGTATYAAQTVANQDLVGGAVPSKVTVLYGTNSGLPSSTDCTAAGTGFGINPVVSVYVQQATLPTFFARVFSLIQGGTSSNSGVSATAYAEAFNPSNSNNGSPIPVQPRCVKPIIIPNQDPWHPTSTCTSATCTTFVNTSTGQITSPGMFASNVSGVIGERFDLFTDCPTTGAAHCVPLTNKPPGVQPSPRGLQYVPGGVSDVTVPVAIPTSGPTCSDVTTPYAQDIAGCDQSTVYQCGVVSTSSNNTVDQKENPANGDVQNAAECLINQTVGNLTSASGQDTLGVYAQGTPPTYPFQIQAGSQNPLVAAGLASGSIITNSSSIVTLPIYDQTTVLNPPTTSITIVGFLQVFINGATTSGELDVTVLNVSGCGNGVSSTAPAVYGTSPVPVRLISPPSS